MRHASRRYLAATIVLASAGAITASSSCAVKSTAACASDADCSGGAVCAEGFCAGGDVPTAAFGAPAEVELGALVSLDASTSTRADGTTTGLEYRWEVLRPEGATLESRNGANAQLRASNPHATYVVQLVVADRGTASEPVTRELAVANTKPVARLVSTPDEWGRSSTIQLDATSSSDADIDPLQYEWTLTKDPVTAPGTLTPGANGKATLQTGATAATYTVKVVVSDGTKSDETTLRRVLSNAPPTLSAGDPQTIQHACTGATGAKTCTADGTLTGTATDGDGTVVMSTVQWRLKAAPPGSHAQATFTPVQDDGLTSAFRITNAGSDPIAGAYEFELTAKDNDGDASTATVIVTVGNRPPTISLGTPSPRTVNHTNDAGANAFVATLAGLAPVVTDPDNDDVAVDFLDFASTRPGVTGTHQVSAGKATYTIKVSRANPTSLLDGTNPLHEVKAKATDVNGESAEAVLPILVVNREPAIPALADQVSPGHTYGVLAAAGAGAAYHHTFPTSATASDPDGDVLTATWKAESSVTTVTDEKLLVVGDALRPTGLTLWSANKAFVESIVSVTCELADPFGKVVTTKKFRVANRTPTLTGLVDQTATQHTYGVHAAAGAAKVYFHSFPVSVQLADPDGDPVTLDWRADAGTGVPGAVGMQLGAPAGGTPTSITFWHAQPAVVSAAIKVTASASDAIGAAEFSAMFQMGNRLPALTSIGYGPAAATGASAVAAFCTSCPPPGMPCRVLGGNPSTVSFSASSQVPYRTSLDATAVDPDGDPITVTWSADQLPCPPNTFCAPSNVFLNGTTFMTPTASCTSGAACPRIAGQAYGTGACVNGVNVARSVVGTQTLRATPSDGIGTGPAKTGTLEIRSCSGCL